MSSRSLEVLNTIINKSLRGMIPSEEINLCFCTDKLLKLSQKTSLQNIILHNCSNENFFVRVYSVFEDGTKKIHYANRILSGYEITNWIFFLIPGIQQIKEVKYGTKLDAFAICLIRESDLSFTKCIFVSKK